MSRAYDNSGFAAFLKKDGGSGRDRAGRTEGPLGDGSQRPRPDRDSQQQSSQLCNGYLTYCRGLSPRVVCRMKVQFEP